MSARIKKQKTPVGIILVIILILGAGVWFITSDKTPEKDTEDTTPDEVVPATPLVIYPDITTTDKKINEGGPSTDYLIAVTYPILATADAKYTANIGTMNTNIASRASSLISDFKSQLEGILVSSSDDQSSLLVNSDVVQSGAIVTVAYTISQYASGAAHPLSFIDTVSYDIRTGEILGLGDLFVANSDYLAKISSKSRELLIKKLGASEKETIDAGTTAEEENFSVFEFTDNGLVLIFNPYQVAPYSAGIIEITIPWNQLPERSVN